jgi:ribosomal protein L37AE/L43A
MTIRYRINDAPEAVGGRSITCLVCGRTSYNPTDVEMFWCANCNKFLRDPGDDDSVYNSPDKVKAALDRAIDDDGLI